MKRQLNSILTTSCLFVTVLLLIATMFSWYVSNKEVNANGIVATSGGNEYSATLERGIYSSGSWTWVETSELKITKMEPGNAFFFRFRITSQTACDLITDFSNNTSSLQTNLMEDNILTVNNGHLSYYGIDLYEIENNEVTILDKTSGSDVSKKLYSISQNNISLHTNTPYLISNTFRFYNYGLSDSATAFNAYDDKIDSTDTLIGTSTTISALDLDNAKVTYSMDSQGVYYAYFSLEFNNQASLVTYKHFDGNYYEDSNLYQFQTISFENIGLISLTA